MTKGTKTIVKYDESGYVTTTQCGFHIQGRPYLQKIKVRVHRKKCPVCSDPKYRDNAAETSHELFKGLAPPKIMKGIVVFTNGLRGCDRSTCAPEV